MQENTNMDDVYVWSDRYDRLFANIYEYLDWCEGQGDEPEEYVFECKPVQMQTYDTGYSIVERIVEGIANDDDYNIDGWGYEDYKSCLKGLDDLEKAIDLAVKEFNKQQGHALQQATNKKIYIKDCTGE